MTQDRWRLSVSPRINSGDDNNTTENERKKITKIQQSTTFQMRILTNFSNTMERTADKIVQKQIHMLTLYHNDIRYRLASEREPRTATGCAEKWQHLKQKEVADPKTVREWNAKSLGKSNMNDERKTLRRLGIVFKQNCCDLESSVKNAGLKKRFQ